MSKPWAPSIVSSCGDQTIYLVIDQSSDKSYLRETDVCQTDRETVLTDLAAGQYDEPIHVIAFSVQNGWSRIVSSEIADELRWRADRAGDDLPASVVEFCDRHGAPDRQLKLRLA